MHNKSGLGIILVIVVAVAGFKIYQNNADSESVATPQVDEVVLAKKPKPKPKVKPASVKDNDFAEDLQILKEQLQQEDAVMTVTDSVYDPDPIVDANMIINTHKLCISQLANKLSSNNYMKRLQNNLDEKQRSFYKNLNNYCQKLNQQHPEYHLSDIQKLKEQIATAQPTSTWGKIINGEISPEDLSNKEVEDLLAQNSVAILSDAPKYLQKYYQEVIHWDLEDVLQNHQYDYVQHIRQYAHQLHLCQIGADCTPNSTMMAVLCFYNSQACGLTYTQYVNNVLTQGQQADIQLALRYLDSKY